MNFLHQKHRKLSEVIPVPEGLRDLMADIAREVLRYQPSNMECFIAEYLEAMLLTRELYWIANRTVEDILDSSYLFVELLRKEGISHKQAEKAVKIIHEEFRSHSEEIGEKPDKNNPLKELEIVNRLISDCNLSVEQAKKASEVIENAWCYYYAHNKKNHLRLNPDFAQHKAAKNTLSVYQKSKSTCDELQTDVIGSFERKSQVNKEREKAAIKIQSWYRGLKERRHFKTMLNAVKVIQKRFKKYKNRADKKHQAEVLEEKSCGIPEPFDDPRKNAAKKILSHYRAYKSRKILKIQHKAATVIQSNFRGFLARKIKK